MDQVRRLPNACAPRSRRSAAADPHRGLGQYGCYPAGTARKCRTLTLHAMAWSSGCSLKTRISPDYLRRLTEVAQEGAAHSVAIGKTRLLGDDVDRVAALFHHRAGGLDAQILDRLGRRLAGLGAERTAGPSRAHAPKPAICWHRSTPGLTKGSIPPTSSRPRRCSTN
jgi:hypothetical protein